jgi:hypothetical protein
MNDPSDQELLPLACRRFSHRVHYGVNRP